jgi:hypothetical protein
VSIIESNAVREFVSRIAERIGDPKDIFHGDLVFVGGGRSPDGRAVILYRERVDGPVLGRRYDLERYAALFDPHLTVSALADIAFVDDVADPTGSGRELVVDWSDGIDHPDEIIYWV